MGRIEEWTNKDHPKKGAVSWMKPEATKQDLVSPEWKKIKCHKASTRCEGKKGHRKSPGLIRGVDKAAGGVRGGTALHPGKNLSEARKGSPIEAIKEGNGLLSVRRKRESQREVGDRTPMVKEKARRKKNAAIT